MGGIETKNLETSSEKKIKDRLDELKLQVQGNAEYEKKIQEIEENLKSSEEREKKGVIEKSISELDVIQYELNKKKLFQQIDSQISYFKNIIESSKGRFANGKE